MTALSRAMDLVLSAQMHAELGHSMALKAFESDGSRRKWYAQLALGQVECAKRLLNEAAELLREHRPEAEQAPAGGDAGGPTPNGGPGPGDPTSSGWTGPAEGSWVA